MGQRFRVVLEVQSNFAGEPEGDVESKTIRDYLESVAGVGDITVLSVEPTEQAQSGPSWTPESPTRKDLRKSRVSKRPKKV